MEDTQRETADGRSIAVRASGENADALEMNALDQAREFFGADIRLRVVRNYVVGQADAQGQHHTTVLVREI
jgi:predicted lysophospholipase L1 biosynthesis ABC-type transport system permease subunit